MDLKLPKSVTRLVSAEAIASAKTYPRDDEVWAMVPASDREIGSLVERIEDDRIFMFSPEGEYLGEVEAKGTVHLHGSPDHPQTLPGCPVFESALTDSILLRAEVSSVPDAEGYERVRIYTPAPFTHHVMIRGWAGQDIHSSWHTAGAAHHTVGVLLKEGKFLEGDVCVVPTMDE